MYKNLYLQAAKTADMIQSGQYRKTQKATDESRQGLVRRPLQMAVASASDTPVDMLAEYMASFRNVPRPQPRPTEEETQVKPKARPWNFEGFGGDDYFNEQLDAFLEKYPGVTKRELYDIMRKESSMNPSAINKDSGAGGLFQILPKAAAELGFTSEEIADMPPGEQLKIYGMYLDRWDYDSKNSLAIMQAAPAYRNADPDTVIYEVGSKAWEQNPGWREGKDGPVTVRSVNKFYRSENSNGGV